jgi:hypothetical protein
MVNPSPTAFAEMLFRKERLFSDNAAKISKLQQDNSVLGAEIRAYKEAFEMLTGCVSEVVRPEPISRKREVKPSNEWVGVLRIAGAGGRVFGYDDIVAAGSIEGVEIKKPSARVQIMGYINAGIVERISDGKFRLIEKNGEPAEADSQINAGHVAELEDSYVAQHPIRNRENVGSSPTVSAPKPLRTNDFLGSSSLATPTHKSIFD